MIEYNDNLLSYSEDVFSRVARWIFWTVPLACLPIIFLARSLRFYGAFVSLLFLIIMIYVSIRQLKSKNTLFGIYSLVLCWLFFTCAGSLVGLAIKASGVIFILFLSIGLAFAFSALIFNPIFISVVGISVFMWGCIFLFFKLMNSFKIEEKFSFANKLLLYFV